MKNKIIKSLFTLAIALIAIPGVYAEVVGIDGTTQTTVDPVVRPEESIPVTVGEIDASVYQVSISWTSMVFDFRYNEDLNRREWVARDSCYQLPYNTSEHFVQSKQNASALYNDASCSVEYTGDVNEYIEDEVVYAKSFGGRISILDESEYGYVIPQLSWEAGEDYDFVRPGLYEKMELIDAYDVSSGDGNEQNPSTGFCYTFGEDDTCYGFLGNLDESSVYLTFNEAKKYDLQLKLTNIYTQLGSGVQPTAGGTIGQLTISLAAVQ